MWYKSRLASVAANQAEDAIVVQFKRNRRTHVPGFMNISPQYSECRGATAI
jgi:hypothetical protein